VRDFVGPSNERVLDSNIIHFKAGGGKGEFVGALQQHVVRQGQGKVRIHRLWLQLQISNQFNIGRCQAFRFCVAVPPGGRGV